MFELWKLRRELSATRKSFVDDRKNLARRGVSREEMLSLDANEHFLTVVIETAIDAFIGNRLLDEARALDVEIPALSEQGMWVDNGQIPDPLLTPKGRAHIRKLIDEEKSRRFDVRTRWVTKIILPVVASLVGILGAIAGLIAVIHSKR